MMKMLRIILTISSVFLSVVYSLTMSPTRRRLHYHSLFSTKGDIVKEPSSSIAEDNWKGFLQHHSGRWFGTQTTHFHLDDEDGSSTEKLLCGTELLANAENTSITHTNFFVKDTTLESTEVYIHPDRVVKQNVSVYVKPTLSSRVCSTVLLGGPRSTTEGLSLQLSFRHNDMRLRFLIVYAASDFMTVPSTSIKIPSTVALDDIVISRERKLPDTTDDVLPSIESFITPENSIMRKPSLLADFGGLFSGVQHHFQDEHSKTVTFNSSVIPESSLSFYKNYERNLQHALKIRENDEEETDIESIPFSKMYDGGIYIETPYVIFAGDDVNIVVAWSMPSDDDSTANKDMRKVYVANVTFSAMENVVKLIGRTKKGGSMIDQPVVKSFTVDVLEKVI